MVVIAVIIGIFIAWLARALCDRNHQHTFVSHWISSSVALLCLISFLLAAPIYYLAVVTETRPVIFPQATLSNGEKTVIFQGMQHFGSENFYKAVVYDIKKALAEGFIIYYEGVQTATPESEEFFVKLSSALTGSADLAGFYKAVGEACGMKFQNDFFSLLDADKIQHPERHVIADVDALEMKAEYERLLRADPAFAKAHVNDFKFSFEKPTSDSISKAVKWLQSGSEDQKKLAGVVCRGLMTLSLGQKDEKNVSPFDPIILDFRNRALVKRILEDEHNKIFITYGANHLSGVFKLLDEKDPRWRIASVKWMRAIEMPKKEYGGRLAVDEAH